MTTEQLIVTLAPGTARRIRQEAAWKQETPSEVVERLILEAFYARVDIPLPSVGEDLPFKVDDLDAD